MSQSSLNKTGQKFLIHLFEKTAGVTASQISMYDLGADLGLSRDEANLITTELMSDNLIEIRTLSGGIGITNDGIKEVKNLGAGGDLADEGPVLGTESILNDNVKNACDLMVSGLKSDLNQLGLDFDAMSEIMADLKTIDIQLGSPKPKTAILRECFRSVQSVLEKSGAFEKAEKINKFSGG